MRAIHRLIDRAEARWRLRTHHFEAAHRIAFESVLLAACAVPAVSGWRSLLMVLLVNALRLRQAEAGRQKASILGRAREAGQVADPALPPEKVRALREIEEAEAWHTWAWPGLAALVAAAEGGSFGWAAALALGATLLRAAYDKWWLPAWRRSRLGWRARRDGLAEFVVAGPRGYLQILIRSRGWVDDAGDATRMTWGAASWTARIQSGGSEVRHAGALYVAP